MFSLFFSCVYRSTRIVSRMFDRLDLISRVRTSNLRWVILVMAPEAAKRLGAGGPSNGGLLPGPGRKAFGLRREGGVLAWELGKSCGRVRINHFPNLKLRFVTSAMPNFGFWSSLANQCSGMRFQAPDRTSWQSIICHMCLLPHAFILQAVAPDKGVQCFSPPAR